MIGLAPPLLALAAAMLDPGRLDRPAVDAAACVATRAPATGCTACVEACPSAAIDLATGPAIDAERCDGCGACTAVCPTGALASDPLAAALGRWLDQVRTAPGSVASVRCELAPTEPDGGSLVVPCLGALRAADLVVAGLRGASAVELAAGSCESCGRAQAGRAGQTSVASARQALGMAGFGAVPLRLTTQGLAPSSRRSPRIVSRRGLLGLGMRQARSVAVEAAREAEPVRSRLDRLAPLPSWHRRLHGAAELAASPLPWSIGLGRVAVAPSCDACGLCVLACPHGLLVLGRAGGGVAGPNACPACRVCAQVCPSHALTIEPVAAGGRPQSAAGAQPQVAVREQAGLTGSFDDTPGTSAIIVSAEHLVGRATRADEAMRAAARRRLPHCGLPGGVP